MIRKTDALNYHSEERAGKIEVKPTKPCYTQRDLSMAYTPGVADPCREIEIIPDRVFDYTAKGNLVAVAWIIKNFSISWLRRWRASRLLESYRSASRPETTTFHE